MFLCRCDWYGDVSMPGRRIPRHPGIETSPWVFLHRDNDWRVYQSGDWTSRAGGFQRGQAANYGCQALSVQASYPNFHQCNNQTARDCRAPIFHCVCGWGLGRVGYCAQRPSLSAGAADACCWENFPECDPIFRPAAPPCFRYLRNV